MSYKVTNKVFGLVGIVAISLSSCGVKKVPVKKTPNSSIIFNYQDNLLQSGYPRYSKPWLVFADKENAVLYPNKKFNLSDKNAAFAEPFIVLKKRRDMYKVAKFEEGTIEEEKIDKSLLKGYGWMHKNDLLLWDEALSNEANGFRLKGILAFNNEKVILNSEKYIQNDSILIYKDPSFEKRTSFKLPVNEIVYIYKFSSDSKRALIGGSAMIAMDKPDNKLYGWVSTDVLSIWGERTAVKLSNTAKEDENRIAIGVEETTESGKVFKALVDSDKLEKKSKLGEIYPLGYLESKNDFEVRFLENVLDYSKNKVHNVVGKPLYYDVYRQIIKDNKKLNLVFVIDGSKDNLDNLASLKSLVQGLEFQMANQDYFEDVTFSATFYNVDKEYKSEYIKFSDDYNVLSNYLDKRFFKNVKNTSNISFNETITDVQDLLSERNDQTNLVVVLGNTLAPEDKAQQSNMTAKLAETNSRLIFYQIKASRNDDYNDFVLFGEKVIGDTSALIAEKKKQKLVNHEDVFEGNLFDVSKGNFGIYRLDYPANSMNQGAIVFPRKGEENKALLLQNAIERTIHDITLDNKHIDSTLTSYFKSTIGVSNTEIKKEFQSLYKVGGAKIATGVAMQLLEEDYSFLNKGVLFKQDESDVSAMEYGVLVDEYELEQIRSYYMNIYDYIFKKSIINNRRLVRRYMTVTKAKTLQRKGISRGFLRKNPMQISLFQTTGLYLGATDTLSVAKLNKWKRKSFMNPVMLAYYFQGFKGLAEDLSVDKGDNSIRENQYGTKFYWVNTNYIPKLDFTYEEALEYLQTEYEKRSEFDSNSKKYIDRVKEGML